MALRGVRSWDNVVTFIVIVFFSLGVVGMVFRHPTSYNYIKSFVPETLSGDTSKTTLPDVADVGAITSLRIASSLNPPINGLYELKLPDNVAGSAAENVSENVPEKEMDGSSSNVYYQRVIVEPTSYLFWVTESQHWIVSFELSGSEPKAQATGYGGDNSSPFSVPSDSWEVLWYDGIVKQDISFLLDPVEKKPGLVPFYECRRKINREEPAKRVNEHENSMQYIRMVDRIFKKAGIPYTVGMGMVLMIYRECELVEQQDYDVHVFVDDWNQTAFDLAIVEINSEGAKNRSNYFYSPIVPRINTQNDSLPGYDTQYQISYMSHYTFSPYYMLDIFVLQKMSRFYWVTFGKEQHWWWFPFEIGYTEFNGLTLPVPSPPICYLIQRYGYKWIVPIESGPESKSTATGLSTYVNRYPKYADASDVPPNFDVWQHVKGCYEHPEIWLEWYNISDFPVEWRERTSEM